MRIRMPIFALCIAFTLSGVVTTTGQAQQSTPTVSSERARAVEKIKEINRWGPEARIVQDLAGNVDELIQAGANGEILIGWGLTRDHQAYRFRWTDNRFSFEKLSPEAAAKQNFVEMSMTVKRSERQAGAAKPQVETLTEQEAFARGHRYYISDAILGEPAGTVRLGQSLRGRLRLVRSPQAAGDVVLELRWTLPGRTHSMYAYPNAPPGRDAKNVSFEFTGFANEKEPAQYQRGVNAVLRVVAQPQAGVPVEPLSNALAVSFRVVP